MTTASCIKRFTSDFIADFRLCLSVISGGRVLEPLGNKINMRESRYLSA